MLPAAWVDDLFAKLAVRYGAAFVRRWDGLDIGMVKADWAEQLSGLTRDDLQHGIENLPADAPPLVGQFRALCRRTAPQAFPALPTPQVDPRAARSIGQRLRGMLRGRGTLDWAYQLRDRDRAGEPLSIAQRQAYREALAHPLAADGEGEGA